MGPKEKNHFKCEVSDKCEEQNSYKIYESLFTFLATFKPWDHFCPLGLRNFAIKQEKLK